MSSGKITYSLGFLPTYVFIEIMKLNSENFEVDIFLPRSGSRSEFWMEIIPKQRLTDGISIKQKLNYQLLTCSAVSFPGFFFRECLSVFLRHPARFCRNAFLSIGLRSFRYFLMGASFAGNIDAQTRIIHSHFAGTAAFAAMWAGKLLHIPFTLTTHAVDIFVPDRENLVTHMLGEADRIFTISSFNQDYISRRYGKELNRKITVTHLGLDLSSLPERKHKINPVPVILCTASGLGEKKGVPVLVEACRILSDRNIEFICKVIGADTEGVQLEKYRQDTNGLGPGGCLEFTGLLPSDEVMERLAEADIFVLPSILAENGDMDGIPVSLMESMAAGVPTVSTSLSGIPELIENGKDGILVPPGDAAGLADAIERLLSDRIFAEEMGRLGSEKVKDQFNVSGYVNLLLKNWSEYL